MNNFSHILQYAAKNNDTTDTNLLLHIPNSFPENSNAEKKAHEKHLPKNFQKRLKPKILTFDKDTPLLR